MAQFYKLKVKSIIRTTDDCVLIAFHVPEELKPIFNYTQGQYLTLKANINNEHVQRSYSLCSSPLDNEWQVGIKKVIGGRFSTYANEVLKVGDTLDALAPNGNFYVDVDPLKKRNYVCFAAGSGITPMVSIIKTQMLMATVM